MVATIVSTLVSASLMVSSLVYIQKTHQKVAESRVINTKEKANKERLISTLKMIAESKRDTLTQNQVSCESVIGSDNCNKIRQKYGFTPYFSTQTSLSVELR